MIWPKVAGWLCVCLLGNVGLVWSQTAVLASGAANTVSALATTAPLAATVIGTTGTASTRPVVQVADQGNTLSGQNKPVYEENHWLEDFEVHFLVSLPFTALYSYAVTSAVDASVQGRFPTEFKPADEWVVLGLALGSSLAVALGSANRVPDQSVPRVAREIEPDFSAEAKPPLKVALIQIDY